MDSSFSLTNEDKLLLLCARTRMKNEYYEEINTLVRQGIDWNYLLRKSYKHRLTPLLYWQINSGCPDSVPSEFMGILKNYFHENARKNLLFMGELLMILKLFKSHKLLGIPYKGPHLAVLTYGNLALRQFDDIDIYIQKKDLQSAKDAMTSRGYEILSHHITNSFIKYQREFTFINKENGVKVEIKWKFPVLSYSFPVNPDYLFEYNELEKIELNGLKSLSLKSENMLLILCIHNAGHLWSRISWICDIAEFVGNNNIDWEKVIEKATKLRIVRILFINLILANEMLGMEIPKEISDIKSDSKLNKIVANIKQRNFSEFYNNPSILNDVKLRLSIRENLIDQIKDLSRLLIKPLEN